MFCITFGSSRRCELRQGAVTFPFILLFDLLFDKDSSRQVPGEAIGSGVLSVIVPNLLLSSQFAPFSFRLPARRA